MWLSSRELGSCVKGLGSNPVSYTFLFYYIILLGTQNDRPIARVCQHQLSFLFFSVCIFRVKFIVAHGNVCSCRHAAIAKYFGDPPPLCNNLCDYCQNPTAVKRLSADAKIGTAPSSNRKRHRVSRLFLCIFKNLFCTT